MSTDNRKNSIRKQVRWPKELVKEIDSIRGAEPFSSWVFRACWEAVKRNPKTGGD